MKTYLKKILTIAICIFAVFATTSFADVMEPDMPVKPRKNDNFYYYNVSSENDIENTTVENKTSNTTKSSKKSSSEEKETDIDFAKIMIIAGGSIAVITAIAIVILAFVSKK